VEPAAKTVRRAYRQLDMVGWLSNGLGGLTIFLFTTLLVPQTISDDQYDTLLLRSAIVFGVVFVVLMPLGRHLSTVRFRETTAWLAEGRPATERERELVLRFPVRYARIAGTLWAIGGVVLAVCNATVAIGPAIAVAIATALGGGMAHALQYLFSERIMRPISAYALAGGGPPPDVKVAGIGTRLAMAWTLATAVPLLGVLVLGVAKLKGADFDEDQLVGAILFLVLAALAVGFVATLVAARSVVDPVSAVGRALERVEGGDFDTQVAVDDGSEVGLLQAGFNRMATGLAERERMRDLFGRHVGADVARAALDGDMHLGGEVRDVGVLFLDIVGSTTLAAERPPEEVVGLLNDFFAIVVAVTEAHHGLVNKFEGDAALCVFGAPTSCDDPAGDALGAGRELRERLRAEVPDVDYGIGVSFGKAVAGNVGAERRFEYTVIGDPVNEGARLCELAKKEPERLLASEAALTSAGEEEARHWALGEAVTLRGRPMATRLATVAA
jgi:adenylate cyclase